MRCIKRLKLIEQLSQRTIVKVMWMISLTFLIMQSPFFQWVAKIMDSNMVGLLYLGVKCCDVCNLYFKTKNRCSRHMAKMWTTVKSRWWVYEHTLKILARPNLKQLGQEVPQSGILEDLQVHNETSCAKTQHQIHVCFVNTTYRPHGLKKVLFFFTVLCTTQLPSRNFLLVVSCWTWELSDGEQLRSQNSGLEMLGLYQPNCSSDWIRMFYDGN